MNVEEYLERSLRTGKEIEKDIERFTWLKSQAEKVTTVLTGMPGGTSQTGSALEVLVVRMDELKEEINQKMLRQLKEQEEIEALIDRLDNDTERQVLKAYYINGQKKIMITKNLNFSRYYISHVFKDALEKLRKLNIVQQML